MYIITIGFLTVIPRQDNNPGWRQQLKETKKELIFTFWDGKNLLITQGEREKKGFTQLFRFPGKWVKHIFAPKIVSIFTLYNDLCQRVLFKKTVIR